MDKDGQRGPTTYHIRGCTPSLFGVRTLVGNWVGIAKSSLGIGRAVEGLKCHVIDGIMWLGPSGCVCKALLFMA